MSEENNENKLMLLLDSHIDWGAEQVDKLIKFKNPILEAVDRPAARMTFRQINKFVSPYISDELKPELQEILTAIINKEYSGAISDAVDLIDGLIDKIKKLPAGVKELASALLEIVKAAIIALLEKEE